MNPPDVTMDEEKVDPQFLMDLQGLVPAVNDVDGPDGESLLVHAVNPVDDDPLCPDMKPVEEGEDVEFCLHPATAWQENELVYRPAKIVRVWSSQGNGCSNLVVMVDGTNDQAGATSGTIWPTSVCYSKTPQAYTWRRKAQQ